MIYHKLRCWKSWLFVQSVVWMTEVTLLQEWVICALQDMEIKVYTYNFFSDIVFSVYVTVKCWYIFITDGQCSSPSHVMQIHLWEVALIVQYVDDSLRFLSDQINGWLVVVKLNNCPVNALACILRLLQFEDMLVEVKLKRFVGIVYAQLFKAVH